MRAIDLAGNDREATNANEKCINRKILLPIADVMVQVGDYINYNAGNWTQADVNKIKASPGSPSVGLKHDLLGTAPNQFTGFTINQSRNGTATINKIHIIYGNCTKTGWRIF